MADEEKKEEPQAGSSDSTPTSTRDANQHANRVVNVEAPAPAQPTEKKPSKWKPRLKAQWAKLGLDSLTLKQMFKGSLPPIIALAGYQSNIWANHFTTLGYLIGIVAILAMSIMPRAKFLQTTILNVFFVCLAAALNLLAIFCGVKAREHTEAPGTPPLAYNSSQSAVLAIWLLFSTYLSNAIRAYRPALRFPVILWSIHNCIALIYGVEIPDMHQAFIFTAHLLEAFLTGIAIAFGVNLFIFPLSSRTVIFKELTGYSMCLGGLLKAQTAYMKSLETWDPETARRQQQEQIANQKGKKKGKVTQPDPVTLLETPQAKTLKGLLAKTFELHSKIDVDIVFAKREIDIGKLDAEDIKKFWTLLRLLMIPVTGLASTLDILQHRAKLYGWLDENLDGSEKEERDDRIQTLHAMMRALQEPFASMSAHINEAIQHVLITLQLTKKPKKDHDEESRDSTAPGSPGFAEAYRRTIDEFYNSRKQTLGDWCAHHGFELPKDFFESEFAGPDGAKQPNDEVRQRYQRRVFLILYLEHLLWRAGHASLDMVLWADQQQQEGKLSRYRLILPSVKTLKKWFKSVFRQKDIGQQDHFTAGADSAGSLTLGDSFIKRKDPEHLPPTNLWEKMGDAVRMIPKVLGSKASAHGFRVATATMTVAIVDYLEYSQRWFLDNRILWALIMVTISMSRTVGQSISNCVMRILGSVCATFGSWVIWYIVDGKTAGVFVFLWLWLFLAQYIVLKVHKLVIVGILMVVTAALDTGYSLQVQQVTPPVAEALGQPAYSPFKVAADRLGAVVCGLFVAYIWTIFPYSLSEGTEIRREMGNSLYLLANYYAIVGQGIKHHVTGTYGDQNVKGTRGFYLFKARQKVFNALVFLRSEMKENDAFSKFQIRIGGRFPAEHYAKLMALINQATQDITLLSYASTSFSMITDERSPWAEDFRKMLVSVNASSFRLTSLLSLLASSLLHGRSLPRYLAAPHPLHQFTRMLESVDQDILSIQHVAEPEYAAFAVMQITATSLHDHVVDIAKHIKALVGEMDFEFHDDPSSEHHLDELP